MNNRRRSFGKNPQKAKVEPLTFPARINKYLAYHKFASRRGADELISAGKVLINNKLAQLGSMVNENDVVEVIEHRKTTYAAYYKPLGKPSQVRNIEEVFPIADLEKDASGIVIFTNDGRVTNAQQRGHLVESEYEVHLTDTFSPSLITLFEKGVRLPDGGHSEPAQVRRIDEKSFFITIRESKPGIIRQMCAELHFQVSRLERTKFAGINLKGMQQGTQQGTQRLLTFDEKKTVQKQFGL